MSRLSPFRASAALVVAALSAVPLHAQRGSPPPDSLPRYELEAVTVSVTRTPTRREEATRAVEVIEARALELTPGRELTDVLKRNASVDVIQFPGLLSGVAIRGFRPQYSGINPRTLILVDGRPAGASNLSTIDMGAVQRVEVLRGPASALYGSSAMGGVVNLVTRRSTGAIAGAASLEYGSFETGRAELSLGGHLAGPLDFDLSLARFGQGAGYRTGSTRTLGGDEVVKLLAGGGEQRLEEQVRDTLLAHSQHAYGSGSLRLGVALAPGWRVDARATRFQAEGVQNPGDLHAAYDSRSLKDLERGSAEVGLSGSAGRHAVTARGFAAREGVDYYDQPDAGRYVSFRTPTTWYGFQLQDALALGEHTLIAGIDGTVAAAESERFTAAGVAGAPYSPHSAIRSAAGFAEARFALLDRRLVTTLGGRIDRVDFEVRETPLLAGYTPNRESHTVFNPSAGARFTLAPGLDLRASGGRAFVTPEAFNVAGYAELRAGAGAVNVTRGNPRLRPESSVTWDAAAVLSRPGAGFEAELTYFHTDVRDRISARSAAGAGELTPTGDTIRTLTTYHNVEEAEIRGVEAGFAWDLGVAASRPFSLRLTANATRILRAEQVAAGSREPILNVADLNLNAGVEYDDLRRFAGRLSARYVGERRDADFSDWANPGTVVFPRFLVLDLGADRRFGARYQVGARLENLTDENYYEVRGYPLPGRSLRLRVGVDF